jgi:AraC family transcriptional regulator, regulatory protein of adaptative response / methylated-DNA-[protein]-cysteine methyltransferase
MEKTGIDYTQMAEDYRRIEKAIWYLERNADRQPGLKEMAESAGLSEFHFQRLFTRWVGISPKRFLQYLTKEYAKTLLEGKDSLLEATYASGLSSPGRLHDLFVTCEAVTPGEYKAEGAGVRISFGFHPSPFGECLLAMTGRGICALAFVENGEREKALEELRRRWPNAQFNHDPQGTWPGVEQVFRLFRGEAGPPVRLLLNGTNFQIKVWEALLHVPTGRVVSYADIAIQIGLPGSARAVGNAVSRNPIPVLIPCHRVIRKAGELGGYRWGIARKKALLGWEAARLEASPASLAGERILSNGWGD